jgi:hypothetical protein
MYWRNASSEPYIWYPQLSQDPNFQQAVKDRWNVIYPYLAAPTIENKIRAYGESLKKSWVYNNEMWPANKSGITYFKDDFTDWSGDEEIATFDAVIENMVAVYRERLAGMNTLITSGDFTE